MAAVRKKNANTTELMIVNDSPGEECRIAIIQNSHLDELYSERVSTATNVGNIYKGRVTNVEPAIQAAFVDFGEGQNGFLHISDLHPKYFPGPERTERVGKKIPRRERPPIQDALRRGDEVLVQVLKEGLGSKGPTLTSYLSIPGRLIVMMPDMDRVGVSRKVEDETKRREMREILDSLDLPDGFGFMLRTAGFDKNKTELKRDAAYLMRLWKVMEKRIKNVGAPCELYTESDLLIRTVRDIVRPSISAIVVDSESAFERVSTFLQVIAPRSAPKVLRYRGTAPIFHSFDIERQIDLIHSREVPLPSGGKLVFDQTEALVAIDVNSGRSRSATDSEINAYQTNLQAADEICRQLRLRDLGGLIVNDLIDMRATRHRKAIEDRFTENLKRDRARTTTAPISEFGILEMTRQRMRPSMRKAHYVACTHCNGRGEIKSPESVAADAVRHAAYLLQFDRVSRVELACAPRVATVLLSAKRRELVRMEDATSKRVDVRVSEAIASDRVDFYAYDDRSADIDVAHLPALRPPSLEELEAQTLLPEPEPMDAEAPAQPRRRRRRRGPADATAIALAGGFDIGLDDEDDLEPVEGSEPDAEESAEQDRPERAPGASQPQHGDFEQGGRRGRRRRRRRGRGGRGDGGYAGGEGLNGGGGPSAAQQADRWIPPSGGLDQPSAVNGELHKSSLPQLDGQPQSTAGQGEGQGGGRRRRRRRGRRGRGGGGGGFNQNSGQGQLAGSDRSFSHEGAEGTLNAGSTAEPQSIWTHSPFDLNPSNIQPSSHSPNADQAWHGDSPEAGEAHHEAAPESPSSEHGSDGTSSNQPGEQRSGRRRRRRRGRGGRANRDQQAGSAAPTAPPEASTDMKPQVVFPTTSPAQSKPRKSLYRRFGRISQQARDSEPRE